MTNDPSFWPRRVQVCWVNRNDQEGRRGRGEERTSPFFSAFNYPYHIAHTSENLSLFVTRAVHMPDPCCKRSSASLIPMVLLLQATLCEAESKEKLIVAKADLNANTIAQRDSDERLKAAREAVNNKHRELLKAARDDPFKVSVRGSRSFTLQGGWFSAFW